jgi:hypothetical protein
MSKRERDKYIKDWDERFRAGMPAEVPANEDALLLTPDQILDAVISLRALDWGTGLDRDEIRRAYPGLPLAIYLRLPDSKRYLYAGEVLHEAGAALSRAEGDFLGPDPDIPAHESVEDGGPPGWGQQPGIYRVPPTIDGGSAEDTEGLVLGEEEPPTP